MSWQRSLGEQVRHLGRALLLLRLRIKRTALGGRLAGLSNKLALDQKRRPFVWKHMAGALASERARGAA